MNEALAADVATLESLLRQTLDVDGYLDFEELKQSPVLPPFRPDDLATPEVAPELLLPPPASGITKLVPGAKAKYGRAVEAARTSHPAEMEAYEWEVFLARALDSRQGLLLTCTRANDRAMIGLFMSVR